MQVGWFWRLYWFAEPGFRLHTREGATIAIGEDEFFLIPGTLRFAPSMERPCAHLFVHFSVEGLPDALWAQLFHLGVAVPGERQLEALRRALEGELRQAGERTLLANLKALALVAQVLARAIEDVPAGRRRQLELAFNAPSPLERARELAVTRRGDCQIAELAREAGASPDHFARQFRTTYGTPPVRYLRELRIQHAVDCLIHTQDSLEEVAERCGFSDRAYFSRVFSEWAGMGPASFRRKCQGF